MMQERTCTRAALLRSVYAPDTTYSTVNFGISYENEFYCAWYRSKCDIREEVPHTLAKLVICLLS